MRTVFLILLFFISCIPEAQKIYVSSGMCKTNMSISVPDRGTGNTYEEFNNSTIVPDLINVLIEKDLNNSFSVKTGLYLHGTTYDFIIWNIESRAPLPGVYREAYRIVRSIPNLKYHSFSRMILVRV